MNPTVRITPLFDLPSSIEKLRAEAAGEGFRFVDKLVTEWRSGENRFARPGEAFLGACQGNELAAVGGLNRDPYADEDGIGRLRHLYVTKSARRSGVASALVRHLVDPAVGHFHVVRLRTASREAANLYISLGFHPVGEEAATHAWSFGPSRMLGVEP